MVKCQFLTLPSDPLGMLCVSDAQNCAKVALFTSWSRPFLLAFVRLCFSVFLFVFLRGCVLACLPVRVFCVCVFSAFFYCVLQARALCFLLCFCLCL